MAAHFRTRPQAREKEASLKTRTCGEGFSCLSTGSGMQRINGNCNTYNELRPKAEYLALEQYLKGRENGTGIDLPAWPRPKPNPEDFTVLSSNSTSLKLRYNEGSEMKKWMEEKDRNFLSRLSYENKTLVFPYEYALMSQAVYLNSTSSEVSEIQSLQAENILFSRGWKRINNRPSLNSVGYFGAAYIHEERKKVVIAHRGTDFKLLQNLWADAWIASGKIPPSCQCAKEYSEMIRSLDQEKKYGFSETGHSLGAIYAEYNAAIVFQCRAVTFDSPGCMNLPGFNLENSQYIRNYLSAPNIVNTSGGHPIDTIRLFIRHVESGGPLQDDVERMLILGMNFFENMCRLSKSQKTFADFIASGWSLGIQAGSELSHQLISQERRLHSMSNILSCFNADLEVPILQKEIKKWPTHKDFLLAIINPSNYDAYANLSEKLAIKLIERNRRYEKFYNSLNGYEEGDILIFSLSDSLIKKNEQQVTARSYTLAAQQAYEEFYTNPYPSLTSSSLPASSSSFFKPGHQEGLEIKSCGVKFQQFHF